LSRNIGISLLATSILLLTGAALAFL